MPNGFGLLLRASSLQQPTCVNDVTKGPATRVSATPGAQPDSSKPGLCGGPAFRFLHHWMRRSSTVSVSSSSHRCTNATCASQ